MLKKAFHLPGRLAGSLSTAQLKVRAKLEGAQHEVARRMATPGRPYVHVPLPTTADHPNNAAPRALMNFAEKVDRVIPDKLRDRGYSMTRLVEAKTDVATSPLHYLVAGSIVAAGVDVYADAFTSAMQLGTLPWVLGAATAAIPLADVGIAHWHKWMDQYSDQLGKFGFYSAQVHHEDPRYMAKYGAARKAFQSWRVLPALGLMALGEPTTTIGAVGQVMANTTLLSAVSSFFIHGWVHSSTPRMDPLKQEFAAAGTVADKAAVLAKHTKWGLISAGQRWGLTLDKEYHAGHHAGRGDDLLTGEKRVRFLTNHGVAGGWLTGALTRYLEKGDRPLLHDKAMYNLTKLLTGEGWEPLSAFSTPEAFTVWQRYRDNPKTDARLLVKKDRVDALVTRMDLATQNLGQLKTQRAAEGASTSLDNQIGALEKHLDDMKTDYERVSKEWGLEAQAPKPSVEPAMTDETVAAEAERLANVPVDAKRIRALVTHAAE